MPEGPPADGRAFDFSGLLLAKAGSMIEVNVIEDPRYRVAVDELA